MSIDARNYDVDRQPGYHRKGPRTVRAGQGRVSGAATRQKPQIKEAVERLFEVKVKSVNTLVTKGKRKYSAPQGPAGDVKIAIVTPRGRAVRSM
jgi:large subunit ribosomal protein L23